MQQNVVALLIVLAWGTPMAAQTREAPFYQPIRNNDLTALRSVVEKSGATMQDARGSTALMYAAAIGSLEAMQLLVDAGAPVNHANSFGATALMWCAGDLAKVRYLLDKGANVNTKAKTGRTPLFIAAMYDGSVEIGRLLIDRGADPKTADQSGMTVLSAAASSNNLEFARLLLDKGADPNVRDTVGFTPLMAAAATADRSGEIVKLLLDRGARVDAVSVDSVEMMKNGPIGIGRLTALLFAAGLGSFRAVELLVNAGADVNAVDIRGMTPLMLAIATDHPDARIVRLLLAQGADPNRKSRKGESALDWARKYRNPEILSLLGLPKNPPAEQAVTARAGVNVRQAIERSVNLLQRTSREFQTRGGCPACHAQHHTGMAVAAARRAGAKVDWALEQAEARTVAAVRGTLEQPLFQVVDPPPGTDGHVFSLLQLQAAGLPPRLATDSLLFHLVAMQRKEGDWPNYGVIRPPFEDGSFTITAKAVRVLRDNPLPGRKAEFQARTARAAEWLAKASPVSTEDRTMQLLGVRWAGGKVPETRIAELLALQRSNGGWGQTEHLPADAYATGEVLYTLRELGFPTSQPQWRRGLEFLLNTQSADGSWHVRTRAAAFQPYFESGFPYGDDQWISQSGTAWAVMALSAAVQ